MIRPDRWSRSRRPPTRISTQGAARGIWGAFGGGGGTQIASGAAQGTYIGVPGSTHKRAYQPPVYVTHWIFLYY